MFSGYLHGLWGGNTGGHSTFCLPSASLFRLGVQAQVGHSSRRQKGLQMCPRAEQAVVSGGHSWSLPCLFQNGVISLIDCTLVEDTESTDEDSMYLPMGKGGSQTGASPLPNSLCLPHP